MEKKIRNEKKKKMIKTNQKKISKDDMDIKILNYRFLRIEIFIVMVILPLNRKIPSSREEKGRVHNSTSKKTKWGSKFRYLNTVTFILITILPPNPNWASRKGSLRPKILKKSILITIFIATQHSSVTNQLLRKLGFWYYAHFVKILSFNPHF